MCTVNPNSNSIPCPCYAILEWEKIFLVLCLCVCHHTSYDTVWMPPNLNHFYFQKNFTVCAFLSLGSSNFKTVVYQLDHADLSTTANIHDSLWCGIVRSCKLENVQLFMFHVWMTICNSHWFLDQEFRCKNCLLKKTNLAWIRFSSRHFVKIVVYTSLLASEKSFQGTKYSFHKN